MQASSLCHRLKTSYVSSWPTWHHKAYLSAIRYFHIMTGHGDLFTIRSERHQTCAQTSVTPSPSPNPSLLQAIKTCWATRAVEPDTIMLWAACCMGLFGFIRVGEFTIKSTQEVDQQTCLLVQDVAVDSHTNPSMVRVHLKQSKTDPLRHGVDIFLGRTDAALCPVAAILAYCAIRPAIVRPFFVVRDGSPLTRDRLVAAVRSALSHAGVDMAHYSRHSFRVGAATTAARAGLSHATIKMLGRWESSAYERYIQTQGESLAAVIQSVFVYGCEFKCMLGGIHVCLGWMRDGCGHAQCHHTYDVVIPDRLSWHAR